MSYSAPARTTTRRIPRIPGAGLLVVIAAIIAALGSQSPSSAHVSGDAVDVGPFDATVWLSKHGTQYDLCQIYSNEPWHYELRAEAIDHGCPPRYADPMRDPRLQQ